MSMTQLIPRYLYERQNNATREKRMQWWREARFGMFIHLGLYSLLGRHEWAMATECIPKDEYEKLAGKYNPEPGSPRAWAQLAKKAGMRYMVFTTKHHEGYCQWNTQQTDFNSMKTGPHRDLVAEFVDACRAEGLRVGFYYSLMDWRHPDGGRCHYDPAARERFLEFTRACVRELMTNYGKIDILWYDVSKPLSSSDAWEADALNQMVRLLQPDILINNRSGLPEDFSTPEGSVTAERSGAARGWEACMTFNGISWGYMHGAEADAWRSRDIIKMLGKACQDQGNLLLNIGPTPDGRVPTDAVMPLEAVGRWLETPSEAVYGHLDPGGAFPSYITTLSRKGRVVYIWRNIWAGTEQGLGGYETKLTSVTCLTTGKQIDFEQNEYRIVLKNLPKTCPDPEAGLAVFKLEFDGELVWKWCPTTEAFSVGWDS